MRSACSYIGKVIKEKILFFLYAVKIKHKLFAIMTIITLLPVIVLGYTLYGISRNDIIDSGRNTLAHSTEQMANVVDFYLETVINKSDVLYRNISMQDKLVKEYDDPLDIVEMCTDLKELLVPLIFEIRYPNMKYSRLSIQDSGKILFTIYSQNPTINFFDGEGNISIRRFDLLKDCSWYHDMTQSQSHFYWRLPYDTTYDGKTEKYFSLNRQFKNISSMKDIGVLSVEVPLEGIQEILNGHLYDKQWWAYLFSEDGQLIMNSNQSNADKDFLKKINKEIPNDKAQGFLGEKTDSRNSMTFFTTSDISGWKLVVAAPDITTRDSIYKTTMMTLLVCILSFIGSLILMVTLSNVITGRLKKLTVKIRNIGNDTSKALETICGNDEIGELDRQFNKMIYRINELIEKEYKVRLNVKMTEVELLQEQLNPHLLYNSLSAIRWMSRNNDIQSISGITENLICFYKAALSKGNLFTKALDEINLITHYISLIREVYRIDVEYRLNVAEKVNDLCCIKLILQPVVENALLHGIRGIDRTGIIDITAGVDGNLLIFEISDNGKGMDEDIILDIMNDNVMDKKGFGIRNVINRIKLFYGDEYGLSISSRPDEGTHVKITLPCCSREAMEELYKKARAV